MKKILMLSAAMLCILQSQGYSATRHFMEEVGDTFARGCLSTLRQGKIIKPTFTASQRSFVTYKNNQYPWKFDITSPKFTGSTQYRGLATWMPSLNERLGELSDTTTIKEGVREALKFVDERQINAQEIVREARYNCTNDLSMINGTIDDQALHSVLDYCIELFTSVYDGGKINNNIPRKRLDEIARDIEYTFYGYEKQILKTSSNLSIPSLKNTAIKLIMATQKW